MEEDDVNEVTIVYIFMSQLAGQSSVIYFL